MALSSQLSDVEKTCLNTCEARCTSLSYFPAELAALDCSYDDRVLGLLLTPSERAQLHERLLKGPCSPKFEWIGIRSVALDRLLVCCPQVVIIGAGMDMRPWRLRWPAGTVVYEVDSPSVCRARDAVSQRLGAPETCERRCVAADLRDWGNVANSLLSAGLDVSRPVAWLAEAVLGFLDVPSMMVLFEGARGLSGAEGSVFVATAPPTLEDKRKTEAAGGKLYHKTFEKSEITAERMRQTGWPGVKFGIIGIRIMQALLLVAVLAVVVSAVESAQETVDIGQYYWTLSDGAQWPAAYGGSVGPQFLDALRAAHSRGVKIRILQNEPGGASDGRDTAELAKEGVAEVRSIDFARLPWASGIFHNKMIVVDGLHAYIGSANSDWRSLAQVKELGAVAWHSPELAEDVLKAFEAFWAVAGTHEMPRVWPESMRTKYNSDAPLRTQFDGYAGDSHVYVPAAPQQFCAPDRTSAADATVLAIRNAKKFVDIEVMDYMPASEFMRPNFYWPVLDDAMRDAAFRGVQVRFLVSRWNHTKSDMAMYLRSLDSLSPRISVRWFVVPDFAGGPQVPFTRVNHAKFLATEGECVVANWNWSADYFVSTGGVALVVRNAAVAAAVDAVFERDWSSAYSHPLD
eukprot:m51a1_g4131 putative phospholipase d3 (630) ;mRNA; f:191122-195018